MSLSFGSLASTAVSTFKGLAVAAAGTEARPAAEGAASPVTAAPVGSAPVTAAPVTADAAASAPVVPAPVATPAERSEPKAAKGRRLGVALDAYA